MFTSEQKLQFNLNFVRQYKKGVLARQKDLQQDIGVAQARVANIDVFDKDWALLWKSFRTARPVHHLLDSLEFYQIAEKFLDSKEREIELTIKAKIENNMDPVQMAMHQVHHKSLLEQLEQSSESDCEEMLTELMMGMMMETEDDEHFRVMHFFTYLLKNCANTPKH